MLNEDLFKKAKEAQEKIISIQKEIESMDVTGESGGGLVKITAKGDGKISKVDISDKLMDMVNDKESDFNKEVLEDLILAALTNAIEKSSKIKNEKISGLGMPI